LTGLFKNPIILFWRNNKMKRVVYLFLIVSLLAAVLAIPVAAEPATRSYILMSKTNGLPAGFEAKVVAAGGVVTRALPEVGLLVVESSDANFKAKAAQISGIRSVMPNLVRQWVQPETKVELVVEFGNPPFSGDDDTRFDLQWGHDAVNAPEAWAAGYTGEGVRVAVLDTGFDLDHPDLAPNINFALSTNFVVGETLSYAINDPFSHGTHTAGTIAAADNAFGTIGVAPNAELVLVKVLGDAGSGTYADVISGILYAASVDADIISMSLGSYLVKSGDCSDPADCYTAREAAELRVALARATTLAYQMGTTVIASAGNGALDMDHSANVVHIPGDSPNVINISATAPIGWATDPGNIFLDNLASYSNYGQSAIDFGAPGGDYIYPGNENCVIAGLIRPCWVFDFVFSTGSNLNPAIASYYWSVGTSMATPHAAGVAAILLEQYGGDLTPAQLKAAMQAAAEDLGKPGNDDAYGAGRVHTGFYDLNP
jgi:lantibiotic leader peptide-processing serine protease